MKDSIDMGKFLELLGPGVWICVAAALLSFVSGLWLVIHAFRQSLGWGLCCLLVPGAALVFLFAKWEAARGPFLLFLVSVGTGWFGMSQVSKILTPDNPEMVGFLESMHPLLNGMSADALPADDPLEDVTAESLQAMQVELNARNTILLVKKEGMDPLDLQAGRELTAEIEQYNRDLAAFRELREAFRSRTEP